MGITAVVNSVSQSGRSVDNAKGQFTDFKSRTKKKIVKVLAERGKTGGGECDICLWRIIEHCIASIDDFERRLARFIGKEGLVGIEGDYLDSSRVLPSNRVIIQEVPASMELVELVNSPVTPVSIEIEAQSPESFSAFSPSSVSTVGAVHKKQTMESVKDKMLATQKEIFFQVKRMTDVQVELLNLKKVK